MAASATGAWAASAVSSLAVAADPHRDGLVVQNYSTSDQSVFVGIGQRARAAEGQELAPGGSMILRGRMARLHIELITSTGTATGGYQGF